MSIPVAFALNNEYALTTYVAIKSMLMSASSKTEYHVYCLIPSGFKCIYMKRIEKLAIEFPFFQVTFIKMGDLFTDAFLGIEHISEQTYYRLLLADLLKDIDRCIYLDGDILVLKDLADLFGSMKEKYYLAGVKAPAYHLWSDEKKAIICSRLGLKSFEHYINAGVLVMNLKKMREDKVVQKLLRVIKEKLPSQDQDALNIVCYEKIQLLSLKYNVPVYFINQNSIEKLFDANEVSEARRSPVIVHFANGKVKPWSNRNLIYAEKWWELAEESEYDLNKIVIEERYQEKERKIKARAIYFREVKDQLKMMIERILWFDQRLNDDFDWNQDPAVYSSFQYMIYAGQQYPGKEKISFEEAEERLKALQDKYSLGQQSKMQPEQLQKVQKMFLILSASGLTLLSEANSIKERRIELDAEDYLSLKEIESMCFQISLGVSLMCKPNKNYGVAISSLVSAYKTISKTGNYTDEINVGLHGTIKMSEI